VATRKQPVRRSVKTPGDAREGAEHALEENIKEIKTWERGLAHHRSRIERLSDTVTQLAAGGPMLLVHVGWFATWIVVNLDLIPGLAPFDPFPFQLLTMIVSLEAIFLSLFVLASQNRLTHQADMRANLDLQIDLLAEREMTAVLRLLQDIARHLDVRLSLTPEQIRDLARKTDINTLTNRMEEFPENPSASTKLRDVSS
jgi:uncharacterized membrane protein